ncbi:hypothetical protein [Pseudoalteromonas ostreae]|nr:hypothetical protein [Pseudoalteromonas ostreae]
MFFDMNFTEWVQVITQIVTAATAVVMAFLGYKTYLQPPEQSSENEPDEAFSDDAEEKLKRILVFKTSKQKTWLSVSNQGLSCHIDDTRQGKGGPQWTLTRTQASEILNTNNYHVNPGYKVKTGTFTLGPRRNWLYSKVLFPEPDYLHGVLKQLLSNTSS